MINNLLLNIDVVYLAYGSTDFRKQIPSLCSLVQNKFNLTPYTKAAFMFCNKRRTSIKVLCYDRNGFVLAQKTLLATENMKFQWPRNSEEMKRITKEQLGWLLSGLKFNPEKYFRDIEISEKNIAN